jgi:hypothetical protein
MTKLAVIVIAAAILWAMLILAAWAYWIGVGRRQGGNLVPTSWHSILTMPLWTARCWIEVTWTAAVKRRETRRHLRKLETMERNAPPGVPVELMTKLRDEIDRLRDQLERSAKRRSHDPDRH